MLAGLSWSLRLRGLRWACGSAGAGACTARRRPDVRDTGVAEAGWTMGMGTEGAAYGAACQAAEVIMIMMDSKVVEAFKLEVEQVAPEFVAVALAAEPA